MSAIPKIIHYCWFGGNPLPKAHQNYIDTWKKFCPDFEIREWNEKSSARILKFGSGMRVIFIQSGLKTDTFRKHFRQSNGRLSQTMQD